MLATLFVGLRAGRGIKDIREYAIANRSYGTIALTLTFLATNIGAGTVIDASARVFSLGIIATVAALGVPISLLLVAKFVAPKMEFFSTCITAGDVMEIL